jgi:hypothetical protein
MNLPLSLLSCFREAVTAIDWPVGFWLKRDLRLVSTFCANSSEVFPWTTSGSFSIVAARLASLRFVLEATLGVKLLLATCEYELCTTFFAY